MTAAAELEWFEPGIPAYHIESKCGRYTVSRMTVSARHTVYYIAWRVKRNDKNKIVARTELASAPIPLNATNEQRAAARDAMKRRCAEDFAERIPRSAHTGKTNGQDQEEHREEAHAS